MRVLQFTQRTADTVSAQLKTILSRGNGPTKTLGAPLLFWHYVRERRGGGPTDIDQLTFACGGDHRLIGEGGWQTRKQADGRTEWIPPPALDAGGPRTNDYHHPERFLLNRSHDRPDPGG